MKKEFNTRVLSGFMELLPEDQFLFDSMKRKIQTVYERFGFVAIDTPVIERSEILHAKAGGETEKQIYRVVKGKDDLSLRFDLTVPLARYVSEYFNELIFPFKRYHIGKVYRGERPQRGRYREFYQCDIDIIGDGRLELVNDAEVLAVINSVFDELKIGDYTVRISNRKLINGLLDLSKEKVEKDLVLQVIDKIEKIGKEKVSEELSIIGLRKDLIKKLIDFVSIKGTNDNVVKRLKSLEAGTNKIFREGVSDLESMLFFLKKFKIPEENYRIDLSIARGLGYYTGTVYETQLDDFPQIGSICSGGRYEDLAELYSDRRLPGVGISIGLTRLFYVLKELNIIDSSEKTATKVIVIPSDDGAVSTSLESVSALRANGINAEIYLEKVNLKKKMKYANRREVQYVVIAQKDSLILKEMKSGEQKEESIENIIKKIS